MNSNMQKVTPPATAKKSPNLPTQFEENERLRKEIARLKEQKQQSKVVAKKKPTRKSVTSGSGFLVSKTGHVITNQHVVNKCKRVSVGDNANRSQQTFSIRTDAMTLPFSRYLH